MYKVPFIKVKSVETLPGSGSFNELLTPKAVSLVCSHCDDKVSMTPLGNWYRPFPGLYAAAYACPACAARSTLTFVTGPKDSGWNPRENPDLALYQWPAPKNLNEPRRDLSDPKYVPERIGNAYAQAASVLNANHTASATLSRRTLEGIAKHFVKDAKPREMLGSLLARLPEHHDLTAPVMSIAKALQEGGNLAAHFDSDNEVDERSASAMLEMLEDLIDLLFVLPHKIEALKAQLSRPPAP